MQKCVGVSSQIFSEIISLILEMPVHCATSPALAQEQQAHMRQRFAPFFRHVYTKEQIQEVMDFFGEELYPCFLFQGEEVIGTLSQKLEILRELFKRPDWLRRLPPEEIEQFLSFMITFSLHLEAFHFDRSKYRKGLQRMTVAVPTQGKRLCEEAAVISLAEGLHKMQQFLGESSPLIVFDQSSEDLFQENHLFLKTLPGTIIHLSLKEILYLSRCVGIEPLIHTALGRLGYGGARNAVFLLAPVIKRLGRGRGVRELFHEHVWEKSADFVLTVDDDVEVPFSNLLSHALFACEEGDHYVACRGYNRGNATKFSIRFLPLETFLTTPEELFASLKWVEQPMCAGMSEYLSKPRIGLNLPFGGEEVYFKGTHAYNFCLSPSVHRGEHRYSGDVEGYLERFLPYALLCSFTHTFIKKHTLPWHDKSVSFSSLKELSAFMIRPDIVQEMQRRFWKEVIHFFTEPFVYQRPLFSDIHGLKTCDVAKASSLRVRRCYQKLREDAELFWALGTCVLAEKNVEKAKKSLNVSLENYPLTEGLYLLFSNVGRGLFNAAVARIPGVKPKECT